MFLKYLVTVFILSVRKNHLAFHFNRSVVIHKFPIQSKLPGGNTDYALLYNLPVSERTRKHCHFLFCVRVLAAMVMM